MWSGVARSRSPSDSIVYVPLSVDHWSIRLHYDSLWDVLTAATLSWGPAMLTRFLYQPTNVPATSPLGGRSWSFYSAYGKNNSTILSVFIFIFLISKYICIVINCTNPVEINRTMTVYWCWVSLPSLQYSCVLFLNVSIGLFWELPDLFICCMLHNNESNIYPLLLMWSMVTSLW